MTPDTITLPIAPEHFWMGAAIVGLLTLSALIYWALEVTGRDYRRPTWEDIPESWRGMAILLGLIWLGLFGLTVVAAYAGVWQMIHPKGESGGAASGLGFGALLAAMLGAPFVIWGTVLKHRTVTFQKEGHITDRINKAVEMLGAEKVEKEYSLGEDGKPIQAERTVANIEVRIGAILSLERIAQDSTAYDKGRDHVRVMEILCAYVRENSNARKPASFNETEEEWKPLKPRLGEATRVAHLDKCEKRFGRAFAYSKAWKWARRLSGPRTDIALAVAVLGRRTLDQRRVEAAWPNPPTDATVWPFEQTWPKLPEKKTDETTTETEITQFETELLSIKRRIANYSGYRLDLRGSNLQKADLSLANLSGAELAEARLEGANFSRAQMVGTRLGKVKAEGASFHLARMQGAFCGEARMEGANLSETWMEGAYLGRARLEGSSLKGSRMVIANLTNAIMEAAQLVGTRLEGALLLGTRMANANLSNARMEGASLFGIGMEGADLNGTKLERVDLSFATLEGASLSHAKIDANTNLTDALLRGASVTYADYSDVRLSQDQIDQMFGDGSVTLPEGLTRPSHWPEWELGWDEFPEEWEKWQADPEGYRPPKPE